MDDNYDDGALQQKVTALVQEIDDLTERLNYALTKITDLEIGMSVVRHTTIPQIERDFYSLESDVRNHSH